jgi:monooxygenase
MDRFGYQQCCRRATDLDMATEPFLDFSSGYVQRALQKFSKQGTRAPWRVYQNYLLDKIALGFASVEDGVMEFSSPADSGHQASHKAEAA